MLSNYPPNNQSPKGVDDYEIICPICMGEMVSEDSGLKCLDCEFENNCEIESDYEN